MASELWVRFEKVTGAPVCRVVAWRRTGKPFPVSCMGGASRLPHDLGTFVVERELGLSGGFFDLTAHGAIFRSSGRRMTKPGRALILAHRTELDEAENAVNAPRPPGRPAWPRPPGRPAVPRPPPPSSRPTAPGRTCPPAARRS
jgi:hypothetical protein